MAAITTVRFTGSGGTFFVGIKYDSTSVKGAAAPTPGTTVHYDFSTKLNGASVPGSTDGLDLKKTGTLASPAAPKPAATPTLRPGRLQRS